MQAPPIDADASSGALPLVDEVDRHVDGGDSVQLYAVELAHQIRAHREDQRASIEVVPPLRSGRPLMWVFGLVAICAITGLAATMMIHADGPPVAATPVNLLPVSASEPCTARMQEIMRAIAQFTRDHHGRPPETLSALGSPYLTVPPVDPVSGEPYLYTKQGSWVSVACPGPSEPVLAETPQQ